MQFTRRYLETVTLTFKAIHSSSCRKPLCRIYALQTKRTFIPFAQFIWFVHLYVNFYSRCHKFQYSHANVWNKQRNERVGACSGRGWPGFMVERRFDPFCMNRIDRLIFYRLRVCSCDVVISIPHLPAVSFVIEVHLFIVIL